MGCRGITRNGRLAANRKAVVEKKTAAEKRKENSSEEREKFLKKILKAKKAEMKNRK
jgi:hypothetical protein